MRILLIILICLNLGTKAQGVATNFVVPDCDGKNQNLFSELDGGKVVVLIWVMPCATCINGALTAQTEVQSALASHPGKITFYLSDDFANNSCQTLKTWCAANGVTDPVLLNNKNVKMSDYGENGMPKLVVLGGSAHKVYYNENAPDITAEGVRAAINSALQDISNPETGLKENHSHITILQPNPANDWLEVKIGQPDSHATMVLLSSSGQLIRELSLLPLLDSASIKIDTHELPEGVYFLRVAGSTFINHHKFIVAH